ncbi:MAG TPA: hypothetical protein VN901_16685 [Candidatus Acidoferrales bacterium]|jgi:hypothetical protein|nr:hypothetical protein [Candidatus Acidoferrales bacterium]
MDSHIKQRRATNRKWCNWGSRCLDGVHRSRRVAHPFAPLCIFFFLTHDEGG